MYYVIIGDIVESKKIDPSERRTLQNRLRESFEEIHRRHPSSLAAKFQITLGDEFQAVLSDPHPLFEMCLAIRAAIWPHLARIVVGANDLYTSFGSEYAIDIDGPAFWDARKSMNDDSFKHPKGPKLRTLTKVTGAIVAPFAELMNASLTLADHFVSSWTREHMNIMRVILDAYGLTDEFKQVDLANKASIRPDVLNRKLKTMKFFDLLRVYRAIESTLRTVEVSR